MIAVHRSVPIVLLLVGFLRPATPAAAATIPVTKTADTADGACDADCSLREAIMLANTDPDHDIVQVPAGHYRLTITGTPEDAGLNGDLDITKATTIVGAGIGATVVDAGEEPGIGQRVFDVVPLGGGFEVAFTGLTITGGWMDNNSVSDTGGGIMIRGGGINASLVDVAVVDNYVSFSGAGVQVDPNSTLTVRRSTIAENFTTFTAWGAGIMANGISATITDSTIAENVATDSGGGIAAVGTTLVVRTTTISGNRANNQGGGIYAVSSPTDLRNVTITNNVADADQLLGGDGGGVNASVTPMTLRNSIVAGNQDASTAGPPAPDCVGPLTSAGHNLLGRSDGCSFAATTGDQVGTAGSPIDPLLGPLADNGGPTARTR